MARRVARSGRILLLVIWLVVACSSPDASPLTGYAFPRHRGFGNGGPTALLDGILEVRAGCLYVRHDDGHRSYVVWPPGYTLRAFGESIAIFDGATRLYSPGGRVREGAGWYSDLDFVRDRLVTGTLPSECPADEYALATGHVENPPP